MDITARTLKDNRLEGRTLADLEDQKIVQSRTSVRFLLHDNL